MKVLRSQNVTTCSIILLLLIALSDQTDGYATAVLTSGKLLRTHRSIRLANSVSEDLPSLIEPVKVRRKAKVKNYTSSSKLTSLNEDDLLDNSILSSTKTEGEKIKPCSKKKISSKADDHKCLDKSSELEIATGTPATFVTTSCSPLVLTVYGEPTPLSRHMVSRGHMYNPSAGLQKEFATACTQFLPPSPLTGPLEAILYFYFSRPKNHYGTGKNANILKPLTAGSWHSKRKDLDNLVKFVLDALNAKAYEDDSQIAVIKSAKFYTEGEPYTKVIIRSLTEGDFENFHFES